MSHLENQTIINIPKKYQHMVAFVNKEGTKEYTVCCEEGYCFGMGIHAIVTSSQNQCLQKIRSIQKCDCSVCKKNREKERE